MADIVTFDGPNKLIIESVVAGDNVTEAAEIYSEWKDWVRMSDNAKFLPAFSPVGGDPVSLTESLDTTFFLENGWRLRGYEGDHKWTITGNILTREPGESVSVPVLGAYTVNVETQVSTVVRLINAGSSLSDADKDDIINRLFLYILENGESFAEAMRLIRAEAAGSIAVNGTENRVKSADGLTDRIVANADEDGRDVLATDGT